MKVHALLTACAERLAERIPRSHAYLECQVLLAHVLERSRSWLFAHPEECVSAELAKRFTCLVQRRLQGQPLEYLTGRCEFLGLVFHVSPDVLVPRPETEMLVEVAIAEMRPRSSPFVADVGTGSGAIGISLAHALPNARITASDISFRALAIAKRNADSLQVTDRLQIVCCDLLSAFGTTFDLIVANLPYVSQPDLLGPACEVVAHEPSVALDGGKDGLEVVAAFLRQAPAHLRCGGILLAEIGSMQGQAVTTLARQAFPAADISILKDLSGLDRILRVRTPS